MGITTVTVSTGRDITALVRPPRSLFVNFPMGNNFGRAGDKALQTQILRQALDFAVSAEEPGLLVDLEHDWGEDFEYFAGPTDEAALAKQMKK